MRYTTSIEIALPRQRVAQLLADPANIPKWLRGVVSHEPIRGEHGQLGTESRVVMRQGSREMECVEVITRREPARFEDIPEGVTVHFDREIAGPGMWSAVRDRLTVAGPQTTLWESESEYRFDSRIVRLLGRLMPGSFRKQSRQQMLDFKAFAERGADIRDG
ncbi:SRPBCC family protein [Nocardia harenae]|uniref:SRPBCC family protein n=1 Tax=Nocardia harenae TaxID=358707 RepID=UPI00082A2299|nr:SRPBCC family protein [Nocardia harenae]